MRTNAHAKSEKSPFFVHKTPVFVVFGRFSVYRSIYSPFARVHLDIWGEKVHTVEMANKKKMMKTVSVLLLFSLMLATAVVFLLASSVPDDYLPLQLLAQERKDTAERSFVDAHAIPFLNAAMDVKPFDHEVREEELNRYLASLDEIANLRPGHRAGGVYAAMDEAGLADPMVKIRDGLITLMIRTKKANKVVSLDVRLTMTDDGLVVALDAVRIGRMPVPKSWVDGSLAVLRAALAQQDQAEEVSERDLDRLLGAVVGGIGGEPLDTTLKFRKKRLRKIDKVSVTDGLIRIHVTPVNADGTPMTQP